MESLFHTSSVFYPNPALTGRRIIAGGSSNSTFSFNFPLHFSSSSSSAPLPSLNLRRESTAAVRARKKKDKKYEDDSHYFAPKQDESTGPFPEAVLLRQKQVQEDGSVMPEFGDDEEEELYDFLNLELQSDLKDDLMRHYEVVYLIHEKHAEEVDAVNEKVQDFLREKKGKIWRMNDWGMRRLAYKIQKAKNAHYILMNFEIEARWINEFKTMLDQDERVIRHLVIKRDKAITEDCPPPLEFHALRAGMDGDDDLDEELDDDEEWDEEDDEEEGEVEDDEEMDDDGVVIVNIDDDDEEEENESVNSTGSGNLRRRNKVADKVRRAIKSNVKGFPRPQLDLSPASFAKVINDAFGKSLSPPFDPYANSINYLIACYLIPYVGLTGYVGANPKLQGPASRQLVAGLLAVESGQDAIIRGLLYERALVKVHPYGISVAEFTNRISVLRNRLGGAGVKDEGLVVPKELGAERKVRGNVLAGDEFSLGYGRTPEEILRIVYGGGNESSPGGFYPKGAQGRIARSHLAYM
ncbi:unnamed protein product [Linum tenue]|uniref:Ribosomal protein S6 n=1 Tax=Linum tenue TaxID=586396 RepID=A0AAV0PAI4_9ROSI|nr:unnamed protein product [Linum tenue]